jgi:type IV pilus assembly protein PilA
MKALIRNRSRRGFTLIELMIVVAIIGILAVLAIYGVSRYLKTSKTAEATNNIGAIAKNANEALTREKMSGAYVAPGGSVGTAFGLCDTATPVPAAIASVKAGKYTSGPTDWVGAADPLKGWYCLKFTIDQPQYYQYNYTATSTTAGPMAIEANGDLDGNGTTSSFYLEGRIVSSALIMAPKPLETNPEE